MQLATALYANHSLDGPVIVCWSENAKCYIFQGSHRPGKVLEFDLGPGKLEF